MTQTWVLRGSLRVRRSSMRVPHRSVQVLRGAVAGAGSLMSARFNAGPSSNPDSAPQGGVCH
jgi:hypothetical protein